MSLGIQTLSHPLSSGEFDFTDPERYDDVDRKQKLISEFLEQRGYDAVLLQRPANFAWFTSGAGMPRLGGEDPTAALFVTSDARVLATNNVDAAQLFDKQLGGLGFQLKQRPWHEARTVLVEDLCRGRAVASDTGMPGTVDESRSISGMRQRLGAAECDRMRQLGALVVHAVEATARHAEAGQTEAEIAGQLAHRLVKHEVQPLWSRAIADGRGAGYRHWTAGDNKLQRWCQIGAVGSRWGLTCKCMRTVVVGSPPDGLITNFQQVAMLTATGLYFSQIGTPLSEVWHKVHRIYEKTGHVDEWQAADQAEVVGYEPTEVQLVPNSDFVLGDGMAMHWHPSIGPIQGGDTILLREKGDELLTRALEWPILVVTVKGASMHLPDLLIREKAG